MSPSFVLLFGDQTADILPNIEALNRQSVHSAGLRDFFRNATDRLRAAIAQAPASYRRQFPGSFESPLELASWAAEHTLTPCNTVLAAALLYMAQLGDLIIAVESDPTALNEPAVVLGTCTGLLAAATAACARNLAELLAMAPAVVELAFHVGLAGECRTASIGDGKLSNNITTSWATLVCNIADMNAVEEAISNFNKSSVLVPCRQAYISARGVSSSATSAPTTVTISGPPSTTSALFRSNTAVFQNTKMIPLPIAAAFHASHLQPIHASQFASLKSLDSLMQYTVRPEATVLSPASGKPYTGTTFVDVLDEALVDIFQAPLLLDAVIAGLSGIVAKESVLATFGPVNSAKALRQAVALKGVTLTPQTLCDVSSETSSSIPPPPPDAIAIVGMATRLPGSETLEEFWEVLEQGRDLHEPIRPDRFDIDSHTDPTGKRRNTTLSPYGVFIDRPGVFDTRLFNMSPREAAQTDPQQRMLLLATYEALEMAGYAPGRTPSTAPRRMGSFIGQTSDDYREANAGQDVDTYFITGGIRAFAPGRLNYHFGWEGPSFSVDTACSSSSAAIQLACTSLAARECDSAVAGGANLLTSSDLFAGLSRGSFLSKTGGCKTFDAAADGYVRADGVGVIVLKRLTDALADRDNILAVIRSAATNHSAEAVSITHPHAATQERLFRLALNKAGLHPHDVDYAELHGTGTQAGDATETKSVTNVLATPGIPRTPLYIGTVKPNLGHGEAASGITSLIKAVLMLRYNSIPPHIGIKVEGRINPKLPDLAALNTHIAMVKTPFVPRAGGDGKRRILVNNFDAAGGNTSFVLEDAPSVRALPATDPRTHHVVAVSARTPVALSGNTRRLLTYIRNHPEASLADIAYSTTARRMHHSLRQAHAVPSISALQKSLEAALEAPPAKAGPRTSRGVVLCFTGQGSQYAGMAAELRATYSVFRESLEACDRICANHGFGSFLTAMENDLATASPVHVQLSIASIEISLATLWQSFGIVPAAVIGHSLGEYAALCTAGVLSLNDCLFLVGRRAQLMLSSCTPGTHAMLALNCSAEVAESLISGSNCDIACVNAPSSTVISGPVDEVAKLQQVCIASQTKATRLDVPFAFHSAQMDAVADEYAAIASKAPFSHPTIPVASTLLGSIVRPPVSSASGTTNCGSLLPEAPAFNGAYLARQMRQSVRFTDAVQSLLKDPTLAADPIWIETGPSPVCLGLVRATIAATGKTSSAPLLLPSLKKEESDGKMLAQALVQVYCANLDIDWQEYHTPFESSLHLLDLPTYAFDLKNYWIQYRGDWALRKGEEQNATTPTSQPAAVAVAPTKTMPTVEPASTTLHRIEEQTVTDGGISVTFITDAGEPTLNRALRGHLVNGAGLCPSSVMGDMAFTAANYIRRISGGRIAKDDCMDARDMSVHKPLLIQSGATRQQIRTRATWNADSSIVSVSFSSQDLADDKKGEESHAHCTVAFGDGQAWQSTWHRNAHLVEARISQLQTAAEKGDDVHKLLRPMVYKLFASFVDYADAYQGMREVYLNSHMLEAAAKVHFRTKPTDGSFVCSPYWIDSIAHLSGFILNGSDTTPADSVYISHGWGSLRVAGPLSADRAYQSYVRMREINSADEKNRGVLSGDVYFFDGNDVVAVCEDLRFQRLRRSILPYLLPSGNGAKASMAAPTPAKALAKSGTATPAKPLAVSAPAVVAVAAPAKPTVAKAASSKSSIILETVASEVGVDISELTDDACFADMGVDSLLAITMTAKLGEVLGRELPATLFTDNQDVSQLLSYFGESSSDAAGTETTMTAIQSASPVAAPVASTPIVTFSTAVSSEQSSDAGDDDSDGVPEVFSRGHTSATGTPTSSQSETPGCPGTSSIDIFRKIIATEVGMDTEEMDNETPLSDLGVDSLLSLSILGAIKEQTGRSLPSSFLMDYPTLGAIQQFLGGASSPATNTPASPQALVEAVQRAVATGATSKYSAQAILLQQGSSSAPALFLLPDGAGSASSYVGLPSLGRKGSVYGLNSPFLGDPTAYTVSMESIVDLFVSEIQRVQPHGPYHLGGWSIGGSYAFEAASQLIHRHGETVSSLILIDAPCPKSLPPLPTETIELLEKIGAFDGLKSAKAVPTKMRDGVKDHFAGSVHALKQYQPTPLSGGASSLQNITLLWARNGVWETVGEAARMRFRGENSTQKNSAGDWIMDPRKSQGPCGWEKLLPGAKIACKVVPGDHFTIMRRPGVNELGRQLSSIRE